MVVHWGPGLGHTCINISTKCMCVCVGGDGGGYVSDPLEAIGTSEPPGVCTGI